MCGITLSIYPVAAPQSPHSPAHKHILAIHDSLAQSNAHRGPDTSDTFTQIVDVDGGQVELRLTSSVLGLRGELTGQPVRGERGVLAWNGQVFHGLDIKQDENDTMAIMRELEAGRDVHELLASIEGPYAFVYYEYATQTLTYQLDLLSRRALLQHLPRSAHASSSSSLSSTTSSPISSSTSPHESSTTPEALASNSATDLAKATSTSASASTAVPPVAVSNSSSSSSSSNGEKIACIADRYFALSSTRSRAARNAGLAFRALGGGEGGVVDVKRIRICQPGGAGDGAAAGAGAGAEVVGGDMDMSAAMRSWESHGLSTPFTRIPPLNTTIPPSTYTPTSQAAESEVGRFIEELTASVMRRVINIPAARAGCACAALLFSGGVDSTLLAYMLHKCLPPHEPIDLVNVAFQRNPDLPIDNNKFRKDKSKDKNKRPTKGAGPGAKTRSRGDRYPGLATAPPPPDVGSELGGSRGAVGSADVPMPVAAMGALDLTGASTSPISTPNAEQDAPSAAPTQGQGTKSNKQKEGEKLPNGLTEAEHARILAEHEYNVPDRIAGYEAVDELRRCCEGREFRFVTVDVTYAEYMAHREQVMDLMYPCTTEMDMSLAYPLYFASRGVGTVDGAPYTVQAKVYFSGLGPDEQLGGYSRHRHAYLYPAYPSASPEADPAPDTAAPGHTAAPGAPTSTGPIPIPSPTQTQRYTSLLASLHSELSRLPTRNTSRDDRALSPFARDARYPYLDLQFIAFLSSLPIQAKVVYELGEGAGDKLLLRLAAGRVGLERSARRVKRAMQFGSRSAKVGGKGKGPGAGRREVGDE